MQTDAVQTLAGRLYWVISAVLLLSPVLAVVLMLGDGVPDYPAPTVVSGAERTAIWAGAAPLLAVAIWVLWQMRALMDCYRRGGVLTARAAGHILGIGQGLGVLAALRLLMPTLLTLIVTHDNPPGQRMLSISVSSDMIGLALASALLILIGWAMRIAAAVADENAGFV